jgi:hypothetical protein
MEDVNFSYCLGKKHKLAVVAAARVYYYPSTIGRMNPYVFGMREVTNRLYFVWKHPELSPALCILSLIVRALLSVFLGLTRFEGYQFPRAGATWWAWFRPSRVG